MLNAAGVFVSLLVLSVPIVYPQTSQGSEDSRTETQTLWAWDANAGQWTVAHDATRARLMNTKSVTPDKFEARETKGQKIFASWTEWLTTAVQSFLGQDSNAGDEAFDEELCLAVGDEKHCLTSDKVHGVDEHYKAASADAKIHADEHDMYARIPPGFGSVPPGFGSVPPKPGGFPGIDPTGKLAQAGVSLLNPHRCPSRGLAVGAEGVLRFLGSVPGAGGDQTLLVEAEAPARYSIYLLCWYKITNTDLAEGAGSRGKNASWVFRKVRMPLRSSGVVSCGSVSSGGSSRSRSGAPQRLFYNILPSIWRPHTTMRPSATSV